MTTYITISTNDPAAPRVMGSGHAPIPVSGETTLERGCCCHAMNTFSKSRNECLGQDRCCVTNEGCFQCAVGCWIYSCVTLCCIPISCALAVAQTNGRCCNERKAAPPSEQCSRCGVRLPSPYNCTATQPSPQDLPPAYDQLGRNSK
jgi:hypothetical protein